MTIDEEEIRNNNRENIKKTLQINYIFKKDNLFLN